MNEENKNEDVLNCLGALLASAQLSVMGEVSREQSVRSAIAIGRITAGLTYALGFQPDQVADRARKLVQETVAAATMDGLFA